jgi:hypothetical protein
MIRSALSAFLLIPFGIAFAQGIVIDHTCTGIEGIPETWISAVRSTVQSHYAHTSHGSQLVYGLEFLEDDNPLYDCEIGYQVLPTTAGAYCVFDGQETDTYITPELYWETAEGLNLTRDVLDHNPALDTSMWGWCCQCDYYGESQVQAYLDAMTMLEGEYPGVTFIYFTGNAQATGAEGYGRHQRNDQIREYCIANGKVLYDFADLDCWWYNPATSGWEQHTYSYGGTDVPSEHPQYYGDEYGHTTAESCRLKGRAWWWMMAVLAGWSPTGISQGETGVGAGCALSMRSPVFVPFTVSVTASEPTELTLSVYDVTGRRVLEVAEGVFGAGEHLFTVDHLPAGVFLVSLFDGSTLSCRRTVVLG